MAVIVSKQIVLPAMGKRLSDYAEGDIVKLNESGSPVEFYVAKHDYESGLNGAGRTLLVRKEGYAYSVWNSGSNVNAYPNSSIDVEMNSTYKGVFDAITLSFIGTTTFYSIPGFGDDNVTTLTRSIFLLSIQEFGVGGNNNSGEGSPLPIASLLVPLYLNGVATTQWTRSPRKSDTNRVYAVHKDGSASTPYAHTTGWYRPCFTFPSDSLFDPDTNEFKGVA